MEWWNFRFQHHGWLALTSERWPVDVKKVTLFVGFLLALFLGFFFSSELLDHNSKQFIIKIWDSFSEFLITNGPLLFLAIAVLPALILPVSPLLALAGIWGESHGVLFASLCGTLALIANCCWTYWVARIFGIKVINRFISLFRKKPISIPEDANISNFFVWSLVLRLTPGIPFIFSNIILGALKMPFQLYIIISAPILTLSSFGYIYATAGIISGDFVNLGGGIAIILCFFITGRLILKRRKNAVWIIRKSRGKF